MNGNVEMLNFIYQNSEMGVNTILQLIEISKDSQFNIQLNAQLCGYKYIHSSARALLNSNDCHAKGISSFDKIKTYFMINMQTMSDKSSSHIAEMLIIGSNMGVIQAIRKCNDYPNAEENIVTLMQKLQNFEEKNINELKIFL